MPIKLNGNKDDSVANNLDDKSMSDFDLFKTQVIRPEDDADYEKKYE